MDISQFVFTCIALVGVLVVALLAIVPTVSEFEFSRRRDHRNTDQVPIQPVKARHP